MYLRSKLLAQIKQKQSFLCVGLDPDITKIPRHLLAEPDPIFAFNKAIIDATEPFCVSYKVNSAFFEATGAKGWESMQKTFDYMPKDCLAIADAKRGDIGNTSDQYAKAFFDTLGADAITLAPYMGNDSIQPFFAYPGKWGIVLALTSNMGSADYEQQKVGDQFLYERVIQNTCSLGSDQNLMFVVGATKPKEFEIIRKHAPHHFLLVPGVGAQGGSLEEVFKFGKNADIGLLINASRSIIYASKEKDFAEAAAAEAQSLQLQMAELMA
jgi:orotidine-5'-phosphate decarboxylase